MFACLGCSPDYRAVRNLVVLSGRFFDGEDEQAHNKVGVITQKIAEQALWIDRRTRWARW